MPRLAALIASASIPASALAGGTFTIQHVASFPPTVIQRINAAGQITGDFQYQSITRAMRYEPGAGPQPLPVPAGTSQSLSVGITSAGACIGRITAPSTGTVAAIWSPTGAITTLANPPGNWTYSTGVGLNDAGVACGFATLALVGSDPQQAWRWTPADGYEMLPQLGGIESICRDINASGTVVGTAVTAGGGVRAVTWAPGGAITDLGVPQGATGSYGLNINDGGVVVGTSAATKAYVWRPSQGWTRLPDLGFKASAYDINNAGWMVGWVDAMPFETVPAVWSPSGQLFNIAALVDQNRFYFSNDFSIPIAISETNLIVVRGYDFTVSGDPVTIIFRVGIEDNCPADLDGDNTVGGDDLGILLGAWGPAPGNAADLDGNGAVDADDLGRLLAAWGPCT
jgi:probable HAF family extracellular repeat protein